jgi:CheY-like chemotaxis protein
VLVNLAGNAVKFTARGGVTLRVRRAAPDELRPAPGGADDPALVPIVFEVADTGPGLDAAEQAALFQPNAVPNAARPAHGGAGLGLAIAAALVRRMGGTIGVRAAPGAGSTFWFAVTAWEEDAPDADGVRRATPAPAAHHASGTRSVLVIDDDPVGRRATERLLRRLGCAVDTADGVAAAWKALRLGHHDAVLVDRRLPDGDGCDLASALRRGEAAQGGAPRRIVALTASADPATRRRCLEAGMDAVLVKPVALDALRDALGIPLPDAAPAAALVAPALAVLEPAED